MHSRIERRGVCRRSTGEYAPPAPLAIVTLGHRLSGTYMTTRCHNDIGFFSSRESAGSNPASVTDVERSRGVSGEDAWVTSRKPMVRIHPGSLKRRSVDVVVARRRGKAEDRVRVPDGPLQVRACMPLGATDPCKVGVVGSTPIRSTRTTRAHGPTERHRPGVAETPVRLWVGPLKRTEGSRIRLAGPHC